MNRLASMMATLQCIACVSPVCERKVMLVLVSAVGHGHIDSSIVGKVGNMTTLMVCDSVGLPSRSLVELPVTLVTVPLDPFWRRC